MKQSIALIGPGRVGCAVSRRLHAAGYPMVAVISRNRLRAAEACGFIGCSPDLASDQIADGAAAQIIMLAVPDQQIQNLALKLQVACQLSKQTTLVHFSGLHPAEIMRQHSSPMSPMSPVSLLSLHPLLPFACRQKAFDSLNQAPWSLESDDPKTLALGQRLVSALGGQFFPLAGDRKVLYHTAACIASNYLVTLLASARDLLVDCGIDAEQAIPLLLPLVQATLENVKDLGPEQGLTGPIVRGDIKTVKEQIQALKNRAPELLPLYLQMGQRTAAMTENSNRLDSECVNAMQNIFSAEMEKHTD